MRLHCNPWFRSVACQSVRMSVRHAFALCKNGWTDRGPGWDKDSWEPKARCIRWKPGVKVKVEGSLYSASTQGNFITEALKCGTRYQRISQFYLPPTQSSTNAMNHTVPAFYLLIPSRSWFSFTKANTETNPNQYARKSRDTNYLIWA